MFSNTTTATNLKKKKKVKRGASLASPGFIQFQLLPPFPPSLPHFTVVSHPYPQSSSKKFDDRKGNQKGRKKKFSSPRPGGRSASLLFGANPPSLVTSPGLRANRSAVGGGCGGRKGGGSRAGLSSPARRASWGAGGDCPI